MKVTVKKKENVTPVPIDTEFIRLDAAMKLANAVPSGGAAKVEVQQGHVSVNGQECLMRGKKLRPGDRFSYDGQQYLICVHAPA